MRATSPTAALPQARKPMSRRRRFRVRTSTDAIGTVAIHPIGRSAVAGSIACLLGPVLVEHVLHMRFTYAESMCDPTHLAPLARAAEEAGYDSFSVPDSLFFPAHSDARYPYNPDGDRAFLEDKPIVEPFTLIPWLAAVTERLRFTTFVIKAPVRPAVLLAKQAASVAVLSGNRLRLGVGISPWPEDFVALGQPWERRGARLDETIAVVRGLTAGGWFEHHGELIDVERMKISPVPTEPIPILVGGHADRALRRAATLGDGWVHGGGDPAELPGLLDRLAELRR